MVPFLHFGAVIVGAPYSLHKDTGISSEINGFSPYGVGTITG